MAEGRVYLVGAGPGDPGLLTLRGRDLLAQADVVIYDRLAAPRLLQYAPQAEHIYAGKAAAAHAMPQEEINQLLIEQARRGRAVVRLKGGDPFLFGRGGEEALALAQAGIPFEIVPGVTAGVAAGAYAGIPLTHRGLASAVAFVTGHEAIKGSGAFTGLDWPALARWNGTLVFYMGVENLPRIGERLMAEGMDPDRPAAVIESASTGAQRTVTAPIGALADAARTAGLRPPALVLIGPVVALRESLRWFERRPLFGQRIVNTRPAARADDLSAPLRALGAEVIEAPCIAIEPADPAPLRQAMTDLGQFDWLIFTSAEGVSGFFAALEECGRDARALAAARLCAIGPATADRLRAFGLRADLIPPDFTSAAIVEALAAVGALQGMRILCARADIAPVALPEALIARGAHVRSVAAYRVVPRQFEAAGLREDLGAGILHWIIFTSPSAIKSFLAQIPAEEVRRSRVGLTSIGPVTTAALKKHGLAPTFEAQPHTAGGLVEAIVERASNAT